MDVKATLNSKTVAELRQLAAQRHIARRSTMKKAELVDALIASDVELTLAIEQITPEQQTAYAAECAAAGIRSANTASEPAPRKKALITRDVAGAAFFDISDGPSGVIVRYGRMYELVTGSGETITVRAHTMVKAVKRLAVKLGIHLDAIDVVKAF